MTVKTYSAKSGEIEKKWWIIDATDIVTGRLAAVVSSILRGKHKPQYTPNVDCGDFVIITNAQKVKFTGKKLENKNYYWHTGYPGGIKSSTPQKMLKGDHPERVVFNAIKNMMSKGPLQQDIISKLKVYKGSEHPHEAQKPEIYDIASKNEKNKR